MRVVVLLIASIGAPAVAASTTTHAPTPVASPEPCALVSSASVAYAATAFPTPNAPFFEVSAELAYDCLRSIPLVPQNATSVVKALRAFWNFDSKLDWLKSPPSTYPIPAVDLMAGLDDIQAAVDNHTLIGEYDFQIALRRLAWRSGEAHMYMPLDLLNIFQWRRRAGHTVAVSLDGLSSSLSYYLEDDLAAEASSPGLPISPIIQINGIPAESYFDSLTPFALSADLDDRWNQVFTSPRYDAGSQTTLFGDPEEYPGASTNITFANGTWHNTINVASNHLSNIHFNFQSGADVYSAVCGRANSTCPALPPHLDSSIPPTRESLGPRIGYPVPLVIDDYGDVAGYFLDGDHDDTAVLSIFKFGQEGRAPQAQQQAVVTQFLAECSRAGKKKLIIDNNGNGGGLILSAYDYFKQLFPDIAPFLAMNARASPELDILGSIGTQMSINDRAHNASDNFIIGDIIAYSPYDAFQYTSLNGSDLSWAQLFGPQSYHNSNFTNLYSRKYSPIDDTLKEGLIMSGFANRSSIPPSPFTPENIILLSDGICDSSCSTFSHLLKYQGKIRSLAVGGRPKTGPMQAVGGTRGSEMRELDEIMTGINIFKTDASEAWNKAVPDTGLQVLEELGCYLMKRGTSDFGVNWDNTILQDDDSLVPWQFRYEAADCRVFWTKDMLQNITSVWARAADVLKANFSNSVCVADSTGQPTSLSGDPHLYNNGVPTNATASDMLSNTPSSSTTGGPSSATSAAPPASHSAKSAASSVVAPLTSVVAVMAAWCVLGL